MTAHPIPTELPLIKEIERRIALVDGLMASLAERRRKRPQARQSYKDRCLREHRKAMAGLRKFEGGAA